MAKWDAHPLPVPSLMNKTRQYEGLGKERRWTMISGIDSIYNDVKLWPKPEKMSDQGEELAYLGVV